MHRDLYVSPLIDGPLWDVVEQIEPVGEEEVFDLSVPTLHNFVRMGLIVHNSTYARCEYSQCNALGTRVGGT